MSDAVARETLDLLNAVSFAARAHRHQLRKDGQTPYASHPFRVCLIVRHVFGIDDPTVLTAALLHDTIEDTTTDFDDLAEQFNSEVARWAAALSKDKRRPDDEREQAYMEQLIAADWPVKICKLADVFDNLLDSAHFPPEKRRKTIERARSYLAALCSHLPEMARQPFEIVSRLLAEKDQ
jgi:guanosine-3',5'-bis(diphosphate) 3'-pyrophosphohydrolase